MPLPNLTLVEGPDVQNASWLCLPIWEDQVSPEEEQVDRLLAGKLEKLRASGDLTGKYGSTVTLYPEGACAFERLLLIGLGEHSSANLFTLTKVAFQAAKGISGKSLPSVTLAVPNVVGGLPTAPLLRRWLGGFLSGTLHPGVRQVDEKRTAPDQLNIWPGSDWNSAEVTTLLAEAQAEARAVLLARELVNLPPNELYPESFAERVQQLAESHSIECRILDVPALQAERMGCLLGVGQGSRRPPRLAYLRWGQGDRTLGIVGKGVTFDSGGLSLKPSEGMLDMKGDMAGAATALAALVAIAELQLPVAVIAVLPLVENMPSGDAFRLGDILTARNGITVEIQNTDAEGRLILADALDYAISQGATHLVDLATLTGACLVALGTEVAGLFGNDSQWTETVRTAIQATGERAWELPMFPEYRDLIKSQFADIRNIGGKYAGAITAAKFLEQFVGTTPWCHLDIAGPAWASDDGPNRDAGGTGAFVASLVELARRYAAGS